MNSPRVGVVVLNCNGLGELIPCLESLRRSTYRPLEICVVDNASTDGSPERVAADFPEVNLIRSPVNLGWSRGNNRGIRHLLDKGIDYIWIINNDVEIDPDCVSRLVELCEDRPDVGVCGPLIYYWEPRDRVWFAGGYVDFDRLEAGHCSTVDEFRSLPATRRYISGCAMFVRREVFERVGLIDERFFIYCEDADFGLRAGRAGFGIEVVPEAAMFHKVSAFSGGEGAQSPFQAFQLLRSTMLFWRKHLGWWGFHRRWCAGHLGKWVNDIPYAWEDPSRRERARAIIDAVWYVLSGQRNPLERPSAPQWFVRLMRRRPWLVAELMALRLPAVQPLIRRRPGVADNAPDGN
ncbi:MAG: hypothetical protein DRP79_10010 [Planctomycetota bacterium]|nr:MAG: hypothetical protein DRP79_10010 [Planctomycetota bacterium]